MLINMNPQMRKKVPMIIWGVKKMPAQWIYERIEYPVHCTGYSVKEFHGWDGSSMIKECIGQEFEYVSAKRRETKPLKWLSVEYA
jgi:hypothetical protein